jgi:hypothetical protein
MLLGCGSDGASTPVTERERPQLGTYHFPDSANAFNIKFDADGTFKSTADGCDYHAYGDGTWAARGDAFELHPNPLEMDFVIWPGDVTFAGKVEDVLVRRGEAADTIVATGLYGGKPFRQTWFLGKVCAGCGSQSTGPCAE